MTFNRIGDDFSSAVGRKTDSSSYWTLLATRQTVNNLRRRSIDDFGARVPRIPQWYRVPNLEGLEESWPSRDFVFLPGQLFLVVAVLVSSRCSRACDAVSAADPRPPPKCPIETLFLVLRSPPRTALARCFLCFSTTRILFEQHRTSSARNKRINLSFETRLNVE